MKLLQECVSKGSLKLFAFSIGYAVQSQTALTADLKSEQLLLFVFDIQQSQTAVTAD